MASGTSDTSSGGGSSPAHGEIISEASGSRQRQPKRGERISGATFDGTNSPETRLQNDAVRQAVADYNSGASDQQAGGIVDPHGLLVGGATGTPSGGNVQAGDPSSLSGS